LDESGSKWRLSNREQADEPLADLINVKDNSGTPQRDVLATVIGTAQTTVMILPRTWGAC